MSTGTFPTRHWNPAILTPSKRAGLDGVAMSHKVAKSRAGASDGIQKCYTNHHPADGEDLNVVWLAHET